MSYGTGGPGRDMTEVAKGWVAKKGILGSEEVGV